MDVIVYGALCPEGEERSCAYRLLALALKQECGVPRLPGIARADGGKPWFPDHPALCFNLSHSHGAAVCALHDRPVGVDVERLRPAPKRLAAGLGDEDFFRLWTAREATVKRQGRGVGALLRPLEPDRLCQCLENFLPGWIVTVCPQKNAPIRVVRIGAEALAGGETGQPAERGEREGP